MEVKKEFIYDPVGSWSGANPYTTAFVYPKDETPYMVKGGFNAVKNFLIGGLSGKSTKVTITPAIVHYTFWWKTSHRQKIETVHCGKVDIVRKSGRGPWEVRVSIGTGFNPYKVIATMKKLPRKWIKELDGYLPVKEEDNRIWRKIVL